MPKRKATAPRTSTPVKSPVETVRDAADSLYRAAEESCYQHDRIGRVFAKSAVEVEIDSATRACELCDKTLRALLQAYEESSASVHPTGPDEIWWKSANALWLASKEFLRRHKGCDVSSRQLKDHGPEKLSSLHAEYELEASALMALRHAAESYRKARPAAA
jgi:hypothetical protein